jgi:hypothetical protein
VSGFFESGFKDYEGLMNKKILLPSENGSGSAKTDTLFLSEP